MDETRGKKYSTGKPCKHGHASDRYVNSNACVECVRLRMGNQRTFIQWCNMQEAAEAAEALANRILVENGPEAYTEHILWRAQLEAKRIAEKAQKQVKREAFKSRIDPLQKKCRECGALVGEQCWVMDGNFDKHLDESEPYHPKRVITPP